MNISSRVDYALSCILRIADKYKKRLVTISEIAHQEKLREDYVAQLLLSMKRRGLLKSCRGADGGYFLAKPPSKIAIKDVVESIEHPIIDIICFRKKARKYKCIHYDDCKIRYLWLDFKKATEGFFMKYTLEALLKKRKEEKSWM